MELADFLNDPVGPGGAPDENPLELALRLAQADDSCWPAFYEELLRGPLVLMMGLGEDGEADHRAPEERSDRLRVITFGDGVVPVFTSQARTLDGGQPAHGALLVQLEGRALLTALRGNRVIMNPYSPNGIQLQPERVAALLDGSLLAPTQPWEVEDDDDVLLRPLAAAELPLVAELGRLFRGRAAVRRAYVAWATFPHDGRGENPLVGLEIDGESAALVREAAAVVKPLLAKGQVVNFLVMNEAATSAAAQYMHARTMPFYERG